MGLGVGGVGWVEDWWELGQRMLGDSDAGLIHKFKMGLTVPTQPVSSTMSEEMSVSHKKYLSMEGESFFIDPTAPRQKITITIVLIRHWNRERDRDGSILELTI